MKLSPELIEGAYQYINSSTRDRELDLRDYKIGVIENLGATLDQFDSIDFSNNDIRRLEGFPILLRLKRLYLSNNRISKIDDILYESLPNLEGLLLMNNQLQELGDIDSLGKFTKLEVVSFLGNPLTTKKHYRLYVIHRIPSLKLLDFKKIKQMERDKANQMFSGENGRKLANEIGVRSKTFVPGENIPQNNGRKPLTAEEADAIKQAISKAKTLEEIERLNQMLKSGFIPGGITASLNMDQQMEY